ncbi:MAG: uncharacterized protein family UPF0137 [Bacteriophage sp.]|nr:MAG: uncharacterized protein family UPF0137 [Bacteriophage sp.]UWG14665.1 MAG: uncharacterized protein family UPF0137 [Bacteriophage sp.]
MSKTLTYASEFAGSIKDKCTCRVHSLDFDFLSQVSAWIKDTYPDREIFSSFSKDIRASDYGSDGRYCLTITCTQNLKGVAAKRELFGQFFNLDGSRKDMTPQQEMEKILADIKKAKEILSCAPAQNADAAVTTAENAVPTATAATPTISESGADASASTPATSLQNCESAPAASAGGSSVSTAGAMQDKPLTTVPDAMRPAFDYSGLTGQTVEDLHFAEDEYRHGKQMAERGLVHMGNAIAAAHDALCGVVQQLDNSKHGNRGDDSFRAWCCSIGITKSTAYNLLQVSALMDGSSPRQRAILEALPPTLLYAVAKPSAPAELVEQVKNGDITTNKQYQEAMAQIKAEKDRADAAETREEEARKAAHEYHEKYEEAAAMRATLLDQQGAYIADIDGLKKQNTKLKQIYRDEYESRIAANLQRQKAEGERDRAEERAKNAEDALKKQPITAVIDEEEIDRRAAEKAWGLADARNAELAKDNANLKKQVAALRSRINDDAQADFEQANYCASLMRAAWDNSKASYSRLVGEDLESTFQTICGTLNSIMEEASLLCRQPPDYDGGDRDE